MGFVRSGTRFVAGLLLGLLSYALVVEPRRLVLTSVRVSAPRLSRAHRFLLLADTHLRAGSAGTYKRIGRAARWAASRGAEAVLLAGDLLESDRDAVIVARRLREALGPLRPIAVFGNHEHRGDGALGLPYGARNDVGAIRCALEREGFELAQDRIVPFGEIDVVGIPWRPGRIGPSARVRDLVRGASRPVLVLAHSPDQLGGLDGTAVVLAVCGHTHGGQIRPPILGAPFTHTRLRPPRPSGLMYLDGVRTYITRGVSQTIPIRFGAPPEATLIELAP